MVDGHIRFADPFAWVLQEFPTVVPCSPIMKVRWTILGKWYCATPGIETCEAPTKLTAKLGRVEPLGDFTRALGKGIFTQSQLDAHHDYWRATTSRKATLAKASLSAVRHSEGSNLGLVLSGLELSSLTDKITWSIFPILPTFGHFWQIFSGIVLFSAMIKTLADAVVRMTQIYLARGCGPWVLLGLWNTLYQLLHVPERWTKAAICLLYTSPSPRDKRQSRMPSSA